MTTNNKKPKCFGQQDNPKVICVWDCEWLTECYYETFKDNIKEYIVEEDAETARKLRVKQ